jgi:hypothetical protein
VELLFNPATAVSNPEACLSIDPGICLPVGDRTKLTNNYDGAHEIHALVQNW